MPVRIREQFYDNERNNLDEKDKFHKRHKLTKCMQEEIENPSSVISNKGIEFII